MRGKTILIYQFFSDTSCRPDCAEILEARWKGVATEVGADGEELAVEVLASEVGIAVDVRVQTRGLLG